MRHMHKKIPFNTVSANASITPKFSTYCMSETPLLTWSEPKQQNGDKIWNYLARIKTKIGIQFMFFVFFCLFVFKSCMCWEHSTQPNVSRMLPEGCSWMKMPWVSPQEKLHQCSLVFITTGWSNLNLEVYHTRTEQGPFYQLLVITTRSEKVWHQLGVKRLISFWNLT